MYVKYFIKKFKLNKISPLTNSLLESTYLLTYNQILLKTIEITLWKPQIYHHSVTHASHVCIDRNRLWKSEHSKTELQIICEY